MITLEKILERFQTYSPNVDTGTIRNAYEIAERAHTGVCRLAGEPYIQHPLRVSNLLLDLHVDADTLCAALLHDVPEDTEYSLADIEANFGKAIAGLVDGVTKISELKYDGSMQTKEVDTLQKMFLTMAKDFRVILIKLADRLDNMRTIAPLPLAKQKQIAHETMEVYVPLANLFGIWEFKKELEDLSFKVLLPTQHDELMSRYSWKTGNHKEYIEQMKRILESACQKIGIKVNIEGRYKNLYSIYQKMRNKERKFDEIYDVFALRVVVMNIDDCYRLLGLVHKLWKYKPGRFKDYIASPKNNGYQSLHTTVFGLKGNMTEFQIRTEDMDLQAEFGIAAHLFYKRSQISRNHHQEWIENLLNLQKEQKSKDQFLHDLKIDIFHDRIFVYTPKGDTIDLPRDATPIDFAYAVHTSLGHLCEKVKINGKEMPISTELQTGDTIEIIPSEDLKGPDIRWLHFVKTHHAKQKIREWLKRETEEKKILLGEELLRKEMRRKGMSVLYGAISRRRGMALNAFGKNSSRDLLVAIAEGEISVHDVVDKMFTDRERRLPDYRDIFSKISHYFRRGQDKSWQKKYRVGIVVTAIDGAGALFDLLQPFRRRHINMQEVSSIGWSKKYFHCYLYFDVESTSEFHDICEELESLDGVKEIQTITPWRKYLFYIVGLLTLGFWILHPIVLKYFIIDRGLQTNMIYFGIIPLFLVLYLFREIVKRGFPDIHQSFGYWFITFFLNSAALSVIIFEVLYFKADFNIALLVASVMIVYSILVLDIIQALRSR